MAPLTEQEEQRLRRALTMIGEEAGRQGEGTPPRGRTAWGLRRRVAVGLLAAAAAVVVVGIVVVEPDQTSPGGSSGDEGAVSNALSYTETIACSKIIAVGEVMELRPAPQPRRAIVVFAVQDWIKPANGQEQITINILNPAKVHDIPWKPGDRLLIQVPRNRNLETGSVRGEGSIRFYGNIYERALPKAADTECPPSWLSRKK